MPDLGIFSLYNVIYIIDFILAAVFIWRLILQPDLNKVYVESSLSAESEKDISDLIILLQSWG